MLLSCVSHWRGCAWRARRQQVDLHDRFVSSDLVGLPVEIAGSLSPDATAIIHPAGPSSGAESFLSLIDLSGSLDPESVGMSLNSDSTLQFWSDVVGALNRSVDFRHVEPETFTILQTISSLAAPLVSSHGCVADSGICLSGAGLDPLPMWTLVLDEAERTYVDIDSVAERLSCFAQGEPLIFGRTFGRLSLIYPRYKGRPVQTGMLRTGLIFSSRARMDLSRAILDLMLGLAYESGFELSPSDVGECFVAVVVPVARQYVWASREQIQGNRSETDSVDSVGYRSEDYALALSLAHLTDGGLMAANWASYIDHYIIGSYSAYLDAPSVSNAPSGGVSDPIRRLSFRQKALWYRSGPCVLAAYPVSRHFSVRNAMKTRVMNESGLMSSEPGVSDRPARRCSPVAIEASGGISNIVYQWEETADQKGDIDSYTYSSYYAPYVSEGLKRCRSLRDSSVPDGRKGEAELTVGIGSLDNATTVSILMFLGAPGSGTSWFFHSLRASWRRGSSRVGHRDARSTPPSADPLAAADSISDTALVVQDLFHPFCMESMRSELSMFFSAAEDETFSGLFRPVPFSANDSFVDVNVGSSEDSSKAELWKGHLGDLIFLLTGGLNRSRLVTKEVVNLPGIIDLYISSKKLAGLNQSLGFSTTSGTGETLTGRIYLSMDLVFIYRQRKHTFPMLGASTCRPCFLLALMRSFVSLDQAKLPFVEMRVPHGVLSDLLLTIQETEKGENLHVHPSGNIALMCTHAALWWYVLKSAQCESSVKVPTEGFEPATFGSETINPTTASSLLSLRQSSLEIDAGTDGHVKIIEYSRLLVEGNLTEYFQQIDIDYTMRGRWGADNVKEGIDFENLFSLIESERESAEWLSARERRFVDSLSPEENLVKAMLMEMRAVEVSTEATTPAGRCLLSDRLYELVREP